MHEVVEYANHSMDLPGGYGVETKSKVIWIECWFKLKGTSRHCRKYPFHFELEIGQAEGQLSW